MNETARINETDFVQTVPAELYREGRLDEAREFLKDESDAESILLLAKVEGKSKRHTVALRLLQDSSDLFTDDHLKARYHALRAALYLELSRLTEMDYRDGALIECEAAIFHYEQAGQTTDAGVAENNLALLLAQAGRLDDAREHLRRARNHFNGNDVKLAEVNDTEAQICLMEGKSLEAYQLSLEAQRVFLDRGEMRLFNEGSRTLQKAIADYSSPPLRVKSMTVEPHHSV